MKKMILILPVTAGVLWGSVGIFVRELVDFGMNGYTVIAVKTVMSSVLLFLGILIYDRSWLKIRVKDMWLFLACGLVGILMLNLCYNEAISQLTLSLAAVLLSLSPIFVMMFVAVVFHERITVRKIVCTVLAVTGCALVSGIVDGGDEIRWSVFGIALGVLAALFYALYSIFSKVAMERGYNVFTVIFYSMLIISLILIPLTQWGMIGDFIAVTPVVSSSFIVCYSLCTAILPYIVYTVALERADAGKAAILAAGGEPVAAMIFGIIFYSEIPTVIMLVGMVLTIAALTFICLPEKEKAQSERM